MASNLDGLRTVFANPVASDLFYDVDNLAVSIESATADLQDIEAGMAAVVTDQIFTLSHALALIRWVPTGSEHHHGYSLSEYAEPPPAIDELLDGVSARLGAKISFPTPFIGERGLQTKYGVATYRAVHAIYQTFRVKQELRTTNLRSVLEIGPGMGRSAFYAFQAGIQDYTTIDLPMGIVAQACFLGATLGPDVIWMEGDDLQADGRIRLLPNTRLDDFDQRFGVVLNVDSLTEMGPVSASQYAKWIATHSRVFLSINHEGNRATIPSLAAVEFEAAEYRRFPYWLRPAYAEEIFRLPSTSSAPIAQILRDRLSAWFSAAKPHQR